MLDNFYFNDTLLTTNSLQCTACVPRIVISAVHDATYSTLCRQTMTIVDSHDDYLHDKGVKEWQKQGPPSVYLDIKLQSIRQSNEASSSIY